MGKVMFMRKGDVHTAPAAPVFLTDEAGNLVTVSAGEKRADIFARCGDFIGIAERKKRRQKPDRCTAERLSDKIDFILHIPWLAHNRLTFIAEAVSVVTVSL